MKNNAILAIRLDAGHTPNGNPQRVFVLFDKKGNIVDTVDEGYRGSGALDHAGYPTKYSLKEHIPSPSTFATSKSEYRNLLKFMERQAEVDEGIRLAEHDMKSRGK